MHIERSYREHTASNIIIFI